MKKKACSVCMENCRRLHGDVDPDADEDVDGEISPVGSSGPKSKENKASEPRQKEKVPTEAYPSFLKKMTEVTITSALVIDLEDFCFCCWSFLNVMELCQAMNVYAIELINN